jgi:hypothetical protein
MSDIVSSKWVIDLIIDQITYNVKQNRQLNEKIIDPTATTIGFAPTAATHELIAKCTATRLELQTAHRAPRAASFAENWLPKELKNHGCDQMITQRLFFQSSSTLHSPLFVSSQTANPATSGPER